MDYNVVNIISKFTDYGKIGIVGNEEGYLNLHTKVNWEYESRTSKIEVLVKVGQDLNSKWYDPSGLQYHITICDLSPFLTTGFSSSLINGVTPTSFSFLSILPNYKISMKYSVPFFDQLQLYFGKGNRSYPFTSICAINSVTVTLLQMVHTFRKCTFNCAILTCFHTLTPFLYYHLFQLTNLVYYFCNIYFLFCFFPSWFPILVPLLLQSLPKCTSNVPTWGYWSWSCWGVNPSNLCTFPLPQKHSEV